MDRFVLELVNQRWISPLLDWVMVGLTTVGFVVLPLLGYTMWRRGRDDRTRQVGVAILWALAGSALLTLLFYYLALRPRPEFFYPNEIRLLLPTPPFPAFPSGHAAAAFATATVLIMAMRRWWVSVLAIAAALAISYSRIYLGHHYPSDLFAGAVFGVAVGAAVYGLLLLEGTLQERVRWLLWPQISLVIVMTQMAYLDSLPKSLLAWPHADKVIHALFFGAVVFWLTMWWPERRVQVGRWALPLAIVLPITLALGEEIVQAFSPLRTGDLLDLSADLAGMVAFWWLSRRLMTSASVQGKVPVET
ncbi:MAG: VanZ family protein [Caldilineaceae bacterium]